MVIVDIIEVAEMYVAKIVVNLNFVLATPMAIQNLVKVVVSIGTKEEYYTKKENDITYVDWIRWILHFMIFPIWIKK